MMDWMIDGEISSSEICRQEHWHLASVIGALQAQGLPRGDAEAFAAFAFRDKSGMQDGETAEDMVTDEQRARLTLKRD